MELGTIGIAVMSIVVIGATLWIIQKITNI